MSAADLCTAACGACRVYEEGVKRVCDDASTFFLERPLLQGHGRPVVVFDVDGTALDDRRKSRRMDKRMARHEPVHTLYSVVSALNYHVLFLTARNISLKEETVENLRAEGYGHGENIVLCPQQGKVDYCAWKDWVRGMLIERGDYHIVACIGDQDMDVLGVHVGERQFRLPEPPLHAREGCSIM